MWSLLEQTIHCRMDFGVDHVAGVVEHVGHRHTAGPQICGVGQFLGGDAFDSRRCSLLEAGFRSAQLARLRASLEYVACDETGQPYHS